MVETIIIAISWTFSQNYTQILYFYRERILIDIEKKSKGQFMFVPQLDLYTTSFLECNVHWTFNIKEIHDDEKKITTLLWAMTKKGARKTMVKTDVHKQVLIVYSL